jgi:hypothetical protein
LTPTFTGLGSLAEATDGCAVPGQMLQGHWLDALVVKLHDFEPLIGVPELFCAPDTVAVYVVPAASGLSGVNVATVSPVLKPTDPLTDPPPEAVTVNDTVLGTTACENVAVGSVETGIPDDPSSGVTPDTTGGVPPDDCVYTASTQ